MAATATGAIKRIADQLGIHPKALRTWGKRAEIDVGDRPGATTSDAERIAQSLNVAVAASLALYRLAGLT